MEGQSEVEKLRLENSHLQLKLRAQEGVVQKLLKEKESAQMAQQEAEETVRQLRHEFQIREKMFGKIREENEKEIATLKSIKQSLEARLLSAYDSDDVTDVAVPDPRDAKLLPVDVASSFSTLPKLSAKEAIDTLSKWEGIDATIDLLNAIVDDKQALLTWKPGSPWTSQWKSVITIYISAPPDTHQLLNNFLQEVVPLLNEKCQSCGCSIIPVFMTAPDVQKCLTEEQILSSTVSVVETADIFVGILRDEATQVTKLEIETGFLNCPNTRPSVFMFLPHSSQQEAKKTITFRLKDRIKKMGGSRNVFVKSCEDSPEEMEWLLTELTNILRQFEVSEVPSVKSQQDVVEVLAYQEDMRRELEQVQTWQTLLEDAPLSLTGVDEVYSKLEDYVSEGGSVATLLLTGSAGNGKSTILAKWIQQLTALGNVTVLYHFVSGRCYSNAELTVIYRRFVQKLLQFCEDKETVPYSCAELERLFTALLEKASTQLTAPEDRLLLVIDSADLITDHETYLSWICKPLPSKIRVVLSAREDRYPDSWKHLPSPTMPSSNLSDIIDIINGVQDRKYRGNKLDDEQVKLLAVSSPEVPLWCVVAVQNLLKCSDIEGEALEECIEELDEYQEVPDLFSKFLQALTSELPNLANVIRQIVKLLFCSRNGLLVSEISQMLGLSTGLVLSVLHELKSRMIITGKSLFSLANEQVQEGVLLQYSAVDYLQEWTPPLLEYFFSRSRNAGLLARTMEELPWLLKRAEMREELLDLVLNVDFLILLCASGRSEELHQYWRYVSTNQLEVVNEYHKSLLALEESKMMLASELSSLFRITGKLLIRLGHLEQALLPLQHALELCESCADNDSMGVSHSLYELAVLHSTAGQLETAQDFYIQTLEILDSCGNQNSQFTLKVLLELASLYKKSGKKEMFDDTYAQIVLIKDAMEQPSIEASELLKKRVEELEEFSYTCKDPSLLADSLNQLGVILAVYGDTDIAEEKFLQCLKHFEVVAPNDYGIVVILQNLGKLYTQKKRYDLAIPLLENVHEIFSKDSSSNISGEIKVIEKLALLYREMGNLDKAELLQSNSSGSSSVNSQVCSEPTGTTSKKLLHLKSEQFGEDNLEVAKVLNNLAVLCCLKDDYLQGIPYYDEAVKIYIAKLGEDHPVTKAALYNKQLAVGTAVQDAV